MDTQGSLEWTEVQCNLTCLSSLSGISIHHTARKEVRDKQGNAMRTATPQTARGWIRLVKPLIVKYIAQVPLATVLWWGGNLCLAFSCKPRPLLLNVGELWEGGNQRGRIYPMLDCTSELTDWNREETTGPMLSGGPNGNWKRVVLRKANQWHCGLHATQKTGVPTGFKLTLHMASLYLELKFHSGDILSTFYLRQFLDVGV